MRSGNLRTLSDLRRSATMLAPYYGRRILTRCDASPAVSGLERRLSHLRTGRSLSRMRTRLTSIRTNRKQLADTSLSAISARGMLSMTALQQ